MRALVVQNLYPPHSYGGYEGFCQATVDAWRENGNEVCVLTSDVQLPSVRGPGEPHVRRVLPIYLREMEIVNPPLRERAAAERRARREIMGAIDGFAPDIVSIWNLAALSTGILNLAHERRLPVVAVVADEWPGFVERLDAWRRPFIGSPARRLAGRAVQSVTGLATRLPDDLDLVVCCASQYLLDRVQSLEAWADHPSTVVPWGVDLTTFRPAQSDDRSWRGRLLITSRLDRRKGLATAIRAIGRLDDVTLELASTGDQALRRELEALADRLGVSDRVAFHERSLGHAELRERYIQSDAVLFPSEWNEPFGLVPLEAMACGTPTIGTGTGGSGEFLVDGENCLRFPAGDDVALASAVNRLAMDEDLRTRVRAGGLRTAREFSQTAAIAKLESVHAEAIALGRTSEAA